VGWASTYLIEPDFYHYADDPSIALIIAVFVLVVVTGAVMGLLGRSIARRVISEH